MYLEKEDKRRFKLAVLASHPIQYQTPFYKYLTESKELDLHVFFCSDIGYKTYTDEGFGQSFKWDTPLLEGYKYEFLKNISLFPNVSKFWGLINPSIIKKLITEKFDALWIHGWSRFTDWLVMIVAIKYNIPVFIRGESNLLSNVPFWKAALKKFILRNLFKKISAFLAIGRYNAEFYEYYDVPKEKIFLVPYCVNNDFFISKANELIPQKEKLRKKYNIPGNLPVILFSGKLISVKRPMDLLKAFELVSREYKCSLVFVGEGVLRNELESYIREKKLNNVFFMGFKNQTELPEFYAMADIFVLPSEHEPWGLVVNEAMCFGLPVIVSNMIGSGGDLIKEGENGYIFQACKIFDLEQKIRLLLSNTVNGSRLRDTSRKIISKWSYKEGVSGILSCLKSIKNN